MRRTRRLPPAAWLLAGALAGAAPAAAMEFHLHEACVGDRAPACGPRLLGAGAITPGDAQRLRLAVDGLPAATRRHLVLTLSSPGGNLLAGLELGRAIRALALDTYLGRRVTALQRDTGGRSRALELAEEAHCLSACAYAFLGGVRREVEPGAAWGVHGIAFLEAPASAAQGAAVAARAAQLVAAYVGEMGVDPRVAEIAARTPSRRMAMLDRSQRRSLRVENVQDADPPWTVEAALDGTPMAAATVERQPGTQVRVGLRCEGNRWRLDTTVLLPAASQGPSASTALPAGAPPQFRLLAGPEAAPLEPLAPWDFLRADRHAVWMASGALAAERLPTLVNAAPLRLDVPRLAAAFGWGPLTLGTRGLADALQVAACSARGLSAGAPGRSASPR